MMFFVLIERMLFYKMQDNVRSNKTGEHSVHYFITKSGFQRTVGERSYHLSQQFLHCCLKIHSVMILYEPYRFAALILVIKPNRAAERYAVVLAQTVVVNKMTHSNFSPRIRKNSAKFTELPLLFVLL